MEAETVSTTDWRDAAAYAPLLEADRSLMAWEWLRRDPLYRAAATSALSRGTSGKPLASAAPFGLVAFENPDLGVPYARPLWRLDVHPYVLRVLPAASDTRADTFDLARFGRLASLLTSASAGHLLLSDGLRAIRLDGPAAAFAGGSLALRYMLEGFESAEAPLLTLRRFIALWRTRSFARSLHKRERRARRWILMLRAYDALTAAADQREIARELLSRSVGERRWRSREPSVRSQVQRLVRSAREMAGGRYRNLLGQ